MDTKRHLLEVGRCPLVHPMQLLLVCGRAFQLKGVNDLHPVHGFASRHRQGAAPRVLVHVKLNPPPSDGALPDVLCNFWSGAGWRLDLG